MMATMFELEADVSRLRNAFYDSIATTRELEAERDALKQRVDDLLVEVATAKEVEREACAKVADERKNWAKRRAQTDRGEAQLYNEQAMVAEEIAIEIRERR